MKAFSLNDPLVDLITRCSRRLEEGRELLSMRDALLSDRLALLEEGHRTAREIVVMGREFCDRIALGD
jgi:hypothetical protein